MDLSSLPSSSSIALKFSIFSWFKSRITFELSLDSLILGRLASVSRIFLNLRSSALQSNQLSEIANTLWMHTVRSYLLILLKARKSLKVCLVLASYLMLATHSSTISSLSSGNLPPCLSYSSRIEISSCMTFLGESLWIKCFALRVDPLRRFAIAKRQLSLSLMISAGEVIFWELIRAAWDFVILDSSLSIRGVRACRTCRDNGELTKL